MKNSYPKKPLPVKPRIGTFRQRYPLLAGFRNLLANSMPFVLIWLAAGINMLAAALAAFFMMLLHCLVEIRRENRRLAQMAKDIRERGNA